MSMSGSQIWQCQKVPGIGKRAIKAEVLVHLYTFRGVRRPVRFHVGEKGSISRSGVGFLDSLTAYIAIIMYSA